MMDYVLRGVEENGLREVPSWFHSARTRPPRSGPITPCLLLLLLLLRHPRLTSCLRPPGALTRGWGHSTEFQLCPFKMQCFLSFSP